MNSRIIWLLVITGAFFSCKKREGNIIVDGQGDGSGYGLVRTDTFTLFTSTIREDSLPGNGLPYSLLGFMNDAKLGKTVANAYVTAILNEPNSDFPNTEEPDSAVLFIPIIDGLNFYGDQNATQEWDIHPLITKFSAASVYYQSAQPDVDLTVKTTWQGNILPTRADSARYKKGRIQLHKGLWIKLAPDIAKKLMQMPKDAYKSDDELAKYFPGLAILPQDNGLSAGQGGIGVYDLSGTGTMGYRASIFLYYRDTDTYVFNFASAAKTLTTGKTGPYPAIVQNQLANPNGNYPVTYVQCLSGLKTWVRMPYLYSVAEGNNIAINKAQITFYIQDSIISTNYPPPPRLNLFRPASASSKRNFLMSGGGVVSFGGLYNQSKGSYTFNITQHIQELMNSKNLQGKDQNYGMYLTVPTAEPVLGTRASIDHSKTKLEITYTKLN